MKEPSVSVVMPAYDAARFIDAALGSIASQTVPPAEVVVVDDASSDDTASRVERWSEQLPIVLLRNERNLGCGAAQRRAIEAARGDLIASLDVDDIWLPDHLETLVPLATDERVIVATRSLRWSPGRGLLTAVGDPTNLPSAGSQPEAILLNNFLFTGSVFWRSAFGEEVEPSVLRQGPDWQNWINLIVRAGCRAVPAPHATVLYRIRDDSLSAAERNLPYDVMIYRLLLDSEEFSDHTEVLERGLRRRLARIEFLRAIEAGHNGDWLSTRRLAAAALRTDPSLRGGLRAGGLGSVALRAALAIVAPRSTVGLRRRRLDHKGIVDAIAIEEYADDVLAS